MGLPANRKNLIINPSFESNAVGWTATNGTITTTGVPFVGTSAALMQSNGTSPYTVNTATGTSGMAAVAGTSYALQFQVKAASTGRVITPTITWYTAAGATISTSTGSTVTDVTTGWLQGTMIVVAPATTAFASVKFSIASPATNEVHYLDAVMLEASTVIGSYIDGNLPADANYRYFWEGTTNNSISDAEYRGVWVEVAAGSPPTAQVYVGGVGPTSTNVTITRTADNETWSVPGFYNRAVVSSDTVPDAQVPLGRNVVFTAYFNGQQINQMTLNVASTTGWIQDPYDPTTAMPINTTLTSRSVLTLANGTMASRVHAPNSARHTVMGAKRQLSITGQRMSEGSVQFILHAFQNSLSDQFKALAQAAPILLIRGIPSWGSVSGLAYMDAPVQEYTEDRYRKYPNDGMTQWVISGDLVAPTTRLPLTGQVTNDQVQTNCTGVSYSTIIARSGSKRYVDIKAAPLTL